MRIRLEKSGGFAYIPALDTSVDVDTSTMGAHDAAELEALVHRAETLEDSTPAVPGRRGADLREYRLSIDDSAGHRSITLHDPIRNPAFAELVDRLHTYREREPS